jgi:Tol biopolymer transport system component
MIIAMVVLSGCTAKPAPEAPPPETPPPLAFVGSDGYVWVLAKPGDLPRFVTQADYPKWTPDHRMLVVSRTEDHPSEGPPSNELWLVSASGKNIRQITHIYPQQARFHAVGGGRTPFVVYSADTAIWRVNLVGSGTRRIVPVVADDLAVSRDGTKLAYVRDTSRDGFPALDEVNVDGSARRAVFNGTRHTCGVFSPSWSPDGKWIAFTLCTAKPSGDEPDLTAIWLIHPDGTGLHMLTRGVAPTWSPGGQWIAYQPNGPDGTKVDLFMIHPDGTGRRQVLPHSDYFTSAGEPNW